MENLVSASNIYYVIIVFLFIIIAILAFFFVDNSEKNKKLTKSLKKLRLSFNELDEQARMIVRTDLELNKTQEELDKRISGLDALQKTSRLISTTLDENEIYHCLDLTTLIELGFEKYFILTPQEKFEFESRLCFGFTQEEEKNILDKIKNDPFFPDMMQKKELVSSMRATKEQLNKITDVFSLKHFVITPFFAQKDIFGIIIAGNEDRSISINEGDEELISILADQIGQAIKNARLFEEVYRSSQKLELTVQERTKQLSSALEEVQKISNTKSEFISAVSHELRTPLTSIKGYASILMTGKLGDIPDKVKDRLEKINKHSDNLVKLINDLLDISRIESGRVEMSFLKHNLASSVANIEDLLLPQMKEKNIKFVSEIPDNLPDISVDVGQIERVLINLVGNAVKFTPNEGTITIAINHDEEKVTVSVSDTGVGISEKDTAKLFDEFYRVDNEINQNVKGTGLGLALAKKIIVAHNGKIWLTSKVNEGTTFYFTLPIKNSKIETNS